MAPEKVGYSLVASLGPGKISLACKAFNSYSHCLHSVSQPDWAWMRQLDHHHSSPSPSPTPSSSQFFSFFFQAAWNPWPQHLLTALLCAKSIKFFRWKKQSLWKLKRNWKLTLPLNSVLTRRANLVTVNEIVTMTRLLGLFPERAWTFLYSGCHLIQTEPSSVFNMIIQMNVNF